MIADIGFLIGNSVDTQENDICLGAYMSIQIKFDISQPLKRLAKLKLDPQNPPVGVPLLYENMAYYCNVCGVLGHQLKD